MRCLDEHADVAVDVLSDMLLHSTMPPEEIEKEKRVVLEEIQAVEDTPDDLIHDLFAHSVWGAHPVGAPVLGYPESVRAFSRNQLLHHLTQHYRPERMVIAAAGHLDHDDLVEQIDQWFVFPDTEPVDFCREIPNLAACARRHYRRDIGQTHICLGATACSYTHPRRWEQLVANTALGDGMSSRLFQRIREQLGLAYSVYSYLEMLEDTGLFGAYMACDTRRAEQAVDVMVDELYRLKNEGLSSDELVSAKAQLKTEWILGQESMDKRMGRLAHQELYADAYRPAEEVLAGIERVTLSGVLEACQDLLDTDRMHRITVGP